MERERRTLWAMWTPFPLLQSYGYAIPSRSIQFDHILDGRGSLADDVVAPLSSNLVDNLCDQLDQNKSELVDLLGAINE